MIIIFIILIVSSALASLGNTVDELTAYGHAIDMIIKLVNNILAHPNNAASYKFSATNENFIKR